MDVKEIYRASYKIICEHLDCIENKYEWAASEVFGLVTYDGGLDEVFVKDILEVLCAILDNRTYEYIRDGQNYRKYIGVCQLLHRNHWIDWGTSIRGAWISSDINSVDILNEYEWYTYETPGEPTKNVIEKVPFTDENIRALIEFIVEEDTD